MGGQQPVETADHGGRAMAIPIGLFGLHGDFPALVAATRQAEALGIDAPGSGAVPAPGLQ